MKVAELFIKCLKREATPFLFGLSGEESLDVMGVLLESKLLFIRNERSRLPGQGAG